MAANHGELPDNGYQAALEQSPDAVIFADHDGVVRFWNRGAEEILGFTAGEVLGQPMDLFIPEHLRERHWEGYRRVMNGAPSRYGRRDMLRVPALRKDGTRISVEFSLLPIEGGGRLAGALAVLRDVTEQFQETRALRKRIAELEAEHGG